MIIMSDRGLYAPWLYSKIVSLGWHPFMLINKQGNFRPQGQGKFRSWPLPPQRWAVTSVGKSTAFLARSVVCNARSWHGFDKGYEDVWLIVTDVAPAQATAV